MKLGKSLYTLVLGMSLWCPLASAQITCSSGSACQTNSVPVFTSNGGNAQVADSIIQQSGSTISVGGSLTATGPISGSEFKIGGSLFAFGSAVNGNAFLGFYAGGNSSNIGINDTGVGENALNNNTTGEGNTAVGAGALPSNTTGGLNTAAGECALPVNTTGSYNTALGYCTDFLNTTGNYNTAIGYQAGPGSGK